eukprot:57859_1
MALSRALRMTSRHIMKASSYARTNRLLPSSYYLSKRLRTYLVGVDGSGYGFSALKTVVSSTACSGDEVICMYFPPNIELMMVQPTTLQTLSKELYDAQHKHTTEIEK